MSKDIDNKLAFLTIMWDKLYSMKHSSLGDLSAHDYCVRSSNIIKSVIVQLNGLHFTNPSLKVGKTTITINNRFHINKCCSVNYALKFLNLLIWSIAVRSKNQFGLYMVEWNHMMLLQGNHQSARTISRIIFNNHVAPNNTAIKNALRKHAHDIISVTNNHYERTILHNIIVTNHAWCYLIYLFAVKYHTRDFVITELKNNISSIINNGTHNPNIIAYLKSLQIMSGAKAQASLMWTLKRSVNFKDIHRYSIALSKINNPNNMYYCNQWHIHKVNGQKLLKLIKHHENIQKQYHSLLKQQSKINQKVAEFKDKHMVSNLE